MKPKVFIEIFCGQRNHWFLQYLGTIINHHKDVALFDTIPKQIRLSFLEHKYEKWSVPSGYNTKETHKKIRYNIITQ